MRSTVVPVLLLAMLATACGDPEGEPGATLSRPAGADEVVVQVMYEGGFVPVEAALTAVPTTTVLGDGTVLTMAPVLAIYPGPAITPFQSVQVPASTVDDLVERAGDLGLLEGPLDFGQPPVADAPDTVVTINAGGRVHRHVANALGVDDPLGGVGDATPGVSEQQAANRRALRTFVSATADLPPGEVTWKPPAIAVYTMGDYQPDPDLPQQEREWPLETGPATTPAPGETVPCTLVEGTDAEVLLEALGEANSLTPWVVGGTATSLAFRPVLPGQPGCGPR